MAIPFLSDIRLPSTGKVYLWTGHNSNFLQYNLWHASASGGMFIKNISSSGDIYFQTNSTTALTLDSSQNATFAGNVISKDTFYLQNAGGHRWQMLFDTNAFNLRYYNGSSWSADAFAIDTSNNATFAGSITAPSSLNFTANTAIIKVGSSWNTGKFQFLNGATTAIEFDIPNNRIKNNLGSYLTASSSTGKFGSFDNQSMSLVTNNTARLTIDTSGNATFASDVTVSGGDLTLSGNGTITTGGYWHIASAANGNGYLDAGGTIYIRDKDAGNADRITIDTATGNTTFANNVTVTNNLTANLLYTDFVQTRNGTKIDFRHQDGSVIMMVDTDDAKVGIGTSSPGNKLTVSTSDDVVAKFLSTDTNAKIRIQDNANSVYIGTSNTENWFGPNSASAGVGNIRLNVGNANSGQAGYIGFGSAPTSGQKLRVSSTINTSTDLSMTAIGADMNVTGTDALSADKTYRGIFADVDSDATGGDTNNEVRLYGLDSQVTDTGDADLIYGVHSAVYNTKTSALDNVTVMAAGRFTGNADNAAGTISNAYGIYANARNKGSGAVNGIYGGRLEVSTGTSDSNISNAYGVYAKVEPGANYSGTISSARGAYIEVESENNNVFNTVYGIQLNIDHNGGTITDAFQMKLTTSGTIADDNWGIHSTGATKHRIDGKIGINVSPSYDFHLQSSGAPTKVFIENDGSNQASVDLSNDDRHVRLITDSTNAFRIYDQTATADRFKLDNNGFVTLPNAYLELKNLNSHAHINATSSSLMIQATNIQAMGNLIPDGTGNRNLGASNRYWAETYTNGVTSGGNIVINSNTPVLTLGVINSSTGNAKIQLYSKNSGTSNGFAIQYNKDTSIDRLEFIDGGGTAAFQFHNGGNAEFEGTLTASQINTGQGATEVHLMNQNVRTSDNVQFADLTLTGNLNIYGDINTQNVTNLDVVDKVITVGKGQDEGHSGGSGLVVDGSGASILWDETNDSWDFNKKIDAANHINLADGKHLLWGGNAIVTHTGSATQIGDNSSGSVVTIASGNSTFTGHVNAATGFRMASGQAIDFIDSNIGYNSIERNTTVGGLQINTGDSASMNILDNGRVGIGTNSPTRKLDVETSDDVVASFVSTDNKAAISINDDDTTGYFSAENGRVGFGTGLGASSSNISILTSNSNVGIGTVSPENKLHILTSTTDATQQLLIQNGSTGDAAIKFNISGDTYSFGIDNSDSDKFKLSAGNLGSNDRITVDSSGLVGIGTSSPENKLEVFGDLRIRNANGSNPTDAGSLIFAETGGTWGSDLYGFRINQEGNNNYLNFQSANTSTVKNILTLTRDTARVGIGTTSPGSPLHIAGTSGSVAGSGILFNGSTAIWQPSDATLTIRPSGTDIATFTNAAVGIGTASPDRKFEVESTGTGEMCITGATGSRLYFRPTSAYTAGGNFGIIVAGTSSSPYLSTMDFTGYNNGVNTIMTMKGDGKVGIGTTSPAYKLDVAGDIKCTTSLKIDAGSPFLGLYNSGTEKAYLQWSQSNDYLTLQSDGDTRFITVGTERIRIKSDGKVGIGTTAPTYKLSVPSGGIEAGGKITYSKSIGSLNATGFAVAGITAAANGNGSSCGFIFTCFGHTGAYQRIVYSCYNGTGTWYAKKVIDEGTNQLDVVASANGSTITFTFKATSSTMSYTPRVTVEATGHNINSTYA